jgi:hypothetical protein
LIVRGSEESVLGDLEGGYRGAEVATVGVRDEPALRSACRARGVEAEASGPFDRDGEVGLGAHSSLPSLHFIRSSVRRVVTASLTICLQMAESGRTADRLDGHRSVSSAAAAV